MIFERKKTLELINSSLEEYKFGNDPKELYEPIKYILSLGGKRLRPFLTLAAANLFTDDYTRALKPALAVEVFHNFTLMHDDIMDKAPIRRNKPTVHEKWNSNIAILSGDVMFVKAYDLLLEADKEHLPEAIRLFNKCAAEVCEGQQHDMNFESREMVSEEEYLHMIKLKTAVLLGFSLRLGALLSGASKKDAELLEEAGINIGLGFQLKDDLLDVFGEQNKVGKKTGGDIAANKKTFLLIKALELANKDQKQNLINLLASSNEEEKIKKVTALYNELQIEKLAEKKAEQHFSKGLQNLKAVDAPIYKKNMLKDFILSLMKREN
ncbi:polyprenyl synthetase family protein [Cytophagaceae bacterium ABcell3]|nr:polyprenyl synthetase family protein [Cytophagaceae bacterium ABcell3]